MRCFHKPLEVEVWTLDSNIFLSEKVQVVKQKMISIKSDGLNDRRCFLETVSSSPRSHFFIPPSTCRQCLHADLHSLHFCFR